MYDIKWAKQQLNNLNPDNKFDTMIYTAAIITKLLERSNIKPIIVGGLSVEIYTNSDYSTRDIDFITFKISEARDTIEKLGFVIDKSSARHLYHTDLQVSIEFPDEELAGSYEKINKLFIDDELYVYVISYEDIIMDRLRAKIYWNEIESKKWGMRILALYYDDLDLEYMLTVNQGAESITEVQELKVWISELKNIRNNIRDKT